MPAAGGHVLLDAAAEAPLVVLGVVGEPEPLDARSWRAGLRIERAGDVTPIAWEELAPERPRRFDAGTRVLVALERLPGWSIWRTRLAGREALGVGRRGEAFLRDPDPETLDLVARYLAVAPEEREREPGVAALAALAASATPAVAGSALARLERVPGLAGRLDPSARGELARLLVAAGRPLELRRQTVRLAGGRRLVSLRPELELLAAPGSPLAADALAARVQIDGGLSAQDVRVLLQRAEPEVRGVALREAPASMQPDPALAALASDPAPAARVGAVQGLAARRGMDAFDTLVPLLGDADPQLQGAAVVAVAGLGEPAVPRLLALAQAGDLDAARGPMLALARIGAPGAPALVVLAESHPEPRVRGFARFLLGRGPEGH